MSGSSLDGIDLACVELVEQSGAWTFEILASECVPYSDDWRKKLQGAIYMDAVSYQLLHTEYGHFLGQQVNAFIQKHQLAYKVGLISSHGHTTFHLPARGMTAQLGDGAAIAAETQLPVVSDLRALDVAFGGQGAPIVPIGEKLLFPDYPLFLNIGGIANISFDLPGKYLAFDVCPANRVMNMIASAAGKEFDEGGMIAAEGKVDQGMLEKLNAFAYYDKPYPKSLANSFGTDEIYPLLQSSGLSLPVQMRTYLEHIVLQTGRSVKQVLENEQADQEMKRKMLVTGGGALNTFLIDSLSKELSGSNIEVVVPAENIVNYKEALAMALIGVLRWRQEYNVFSSVTGARRNSIGGAVWMGGEA